MDHHSLHSFRHVGWKDPGPTIEEGIIELWFIQGWTCFDRDYQRHDSGDVLILSFWREE